MDAVSELALKSTRMIDADHPAVVEFARKTTAAARDARERGVVLYYAVRDRVRYDPYKLDLSPGGLSASRVLADGFGWCVPKATLLAAACRAVGVPARLGLADVRNHLSTARLREAMGTDIFYGHGYTAMHLGGQWLKATPAFNVELCDKLGLRTLEFDGTADSIYHPVRPGGEAPHGIPAFSRRIRRCAAQRSARSVRRTLPATGAPGRGRLAGRSLA